MNRVDMAWTYFYGAMMQLSKNPFAQAKDVAEHAFAMVDVFLDVSKSCPPAHGADATGTESVVSASSSASSPPTTVVTPAADNSRGEFERWHVGYKESEAYSTSTADTDMLKAWDAGYDAARQAFDR